MSMSLNWILSQYPVEDINLAELSTLEKQNYFIDKRTIRVSFTRTESREKFINELLTKIQGEKTIYVSIDPNETEDIIARNSINGFSNFNVREWNEVKAQDNVDPDIKVIFFECGKADMGLCYHGTYTWVRDKICPTRIHKDTLIIMVK